jgi:hypothetical protein
MVGTNVLIKWALPFTGGQGIPLTRFTIHFKDKAGELHEHTSYCVGTESTVRTNMQCTIPMAMVTSAPNYDASDINFGGLGLTKGDLIVARVSAENSKGTSPYSNENTEGEQA